MFISDDVKQHAFLLPSFSANATLAQSIIDGYSCLNIAQVTAGVSLLLPTPSNPANAILMFITNSGTAKFNINGIDISPGGYGLLLWGAGQWQSITTPPTNVVTPAANLFATTTETGIGFVTGVDSSFTAVAGRKYFLDWSANLEANVANARIGFELAVDGITYNTKTTLVPAASSHQGLASSTVILGLSAGLHTIGFKRATANSRTTPQSSFTVTVAEFLL